MLDFFYLLATFFHRIFSLLGDTVIPFGGGLDDSTTLGGILFACIVIGFAVSVFWKGAKSQ